MQHERMLQTLGRRRVVSTLLLCNPFALLLWVLLGPGAGLGEVWMVSHQSGLISRRMVLPSKGR